MIKTLTKNKKQIALFFIAGILSACIELYLMKMLSLPNVLPSWFSFEDKEHAYPLSNLISSGFGITSNYFFSIYFVFERGRHSKRKEFVLFIVLSIVTMLINYRLFALLHSYIFEPVDLYFLTIGDIVFCKASTIFIISLVSYVIKKKLVFSK